MSYALAQRWLNYRGNVTSGLRVGQAMGPNTTNELLYVVEWSYDEASDTTRVGLAYIAPPAEVEA